MSADGESMPPDWTDDEDDYGWDQHYYERPDNDADFDPSEQSEGYEE